MSLNAWFEHFKEQLQGLTESFEKSGSAQSLLSFALKENFLRSEEYLNWAMNHYKLPLLQSRFFSETPLTQEMFAKWATHYPWSMECLPVAEWDGSIIVACLQPPQDFPLNPTCVFVLADPQDLEHAWVKANPSVSVASSKNDAPEGIDFNLSVSSQKSGDSFSFEDLGVKSDTQSSQVDIPALEETALDESGKLEGLLDTPPPISLQPTTPSVAVSEEVVKQEPPAAIKEQPLELAPLPPIPAPPIAANKKSEAHLPPPPPSIQAAVMERVEPSAPTEVASSVPSEPVTKPSIVLATKPNTPSPIINTNTGLVHFCLEKFKKKNATAISEKIKHTLSEMKNHFDKAMILTLDEQESQLAAFAWDENFQGMNSTSTPVPLKRPSIFNIVATTQKPFHGYISLNEINEKFFEDWNQGRIPDHVTITPIIVEDKIVGMLLGIAEKSAYNKASLGLAEKLSNDFSRSLQAA